MPLPPPPCRLENAGPTPEATWNPGPAPPPGRRPDASAAAAVLTAAQAAVLTPSKRPSFSRRSAVGVRTAAASTSARHRPRTPTGRRRALNGGPSASWKRRRAGVEAAAVLTPTVERRLTTARAGRRQDGGPGPRPAAVQRPDGGRTGLGCWVLLGRYSCTPTLPIHLAGTYRGGGGPGPRSGVRSF